MEKYLGLDIGGTNVKMGLVTREGVLLEKHKFSTAALRKSGNFIEGIIFLIKDFLMTHPDIKSVGIGVPGTLNKTRTVTIEMPNIPEMNTVPLLDLLHAAMPGIRFELENDANAAALGEYYCSKEMLPKDFLFVTLGTGVGGGAIIDGKIFKGGDGNALEIGHIMSGNGKTVEQNIGKKAILKKVGKLLKKGKVVTKLGTDYTAKTVTKAALAGDPLALKVFTKAGKVLGECLVSGIRMLDVGTVLIGGGEAELMPIFNEPMHKVLHKHLSPYYLNKLDIKVATLGNDAGIIGAASLCFEKVTDAPAAATAL